MTTSPNGFVQLKYKGVVRVPTPERAIAAILLSDGSERTIAVPLDDLEEGLFRRTEQIADRKPQPYRLFLNCLNELGAKLDSVKILYTPALDLSTHLNIRTNGDSNITVKAFCSEAIACAEVAKIPIYAEEKIMEAISTNKSELSF